MTQTVTIHDYFNAFMKILDDNYVRPDRVDKAKARERFESIKEDSPDKAYQLHCATAQTLWALNDNHIRFIGPITKIDAADSTTNDTPPLPEGKMETGNIAYLSLPGVSPAERKTGNYIRTGNQVLQTLIEQNPIGAILDLRGNGGGDCWQMMAAVAALLDPEHSVNFMKEDPSKGITTIRWDHIKHHIDCQSARGPEVVAFTAKSDAPANASLPVAVLYGPLTASSGEITALLFKGSPLSRSFGAATGGFSSATTSFEAPFKDHFGKATMHLTTEYVADRHHNVCKGESIEPDIPCDNPMEQAISWIRDFKHP